MLTVVSDWKSSLLYKEIDSSQRVPIYENQKQIVSPAECVSAVDHVDYHPSSRGIDPRKIF